MLGKSYKLTVYLVRGFLFLCSFVFCLWLGNVPFTTESLEMGGIVRAQSPDANQLVKQGIEFYQLGNVKTAIEIWEKALVIYQNNYNSGAEVIVRENLARAYQETGKSEKAIIYWQQIIAYYEQVRNFTKMGRSLTEQAQIYSSLGQPQKAIALLCNPDQNQTCSPKSAVEIAHTYKDLIGESTALGSLGDANRLVGNYDLAIKNLKSSLTIANKLNLPELRVAVLNSLGNAHISLALVKYRRADSAIQRGDDVTKLLNDAKQEDQKALQYLQTSLEIARSQKDSASEMRSLLRIIPLYDRNNAKIEAINNLQQGIKLLESLPNNREFVYATIDLVNLLQSTRRNTTSLGISCLKPEAFTQATTLLNRAIKVAQNINDTRAESFALGELGHIYEYCQEYSPALEITTKARLAAEQNLKAQDSLYLWEWQSARILQAQGKTKAAISAYEQAINTLDTIRRDILIANRDIQFDFRDTIEPIYRELVALRLNLEQPIETANKSGDYSEKRHSKIIAFQTNQDSGENLGAILSTINSLKLAELQNYFGNDCIIVPLQKTNIEQAGNVATAFINTIILDNQTAVILTLPDGKKQLSVIKTKRQNVIDTINQFRRTLESFRDLEFDNTSAKEVYDWLIRPFEKYLTNNKIKTLVFIQDGILRSVPMAALHDGKQFLIQKYAVATIPSLELTDIKPLNRKNLRILALGLNETANIDGQTWEPLSNVAKEIDAVITRIPGKKLLNDEFTGDRLKAELKQQFYSIIHIATHGEFGSEPEDTFIITGKNPATGKHEKLSFNELDQKIRSVTRSNNLLELLALTACKTAAGDERSTLGLAGVAIQAGAKSALASLWAIQDHATAEIAISFYSKLLNDPNMSKAEALQATQTEFITGKTEVGEQFTHPAYWSPLVLIGNWL
jgi:CHAT domain-containing protein